MNEAAADPWIFRAVVTATGALVIFVATRVLDWVGGLQRERRGRESMIRALFAEIDFNTVDLLRFEPASPSLDAIEGAIRADRAFVPHVTDARHTDIYRAWLPELHRLGDGYLGDVVRFYGDLEKIRDQIASLSRPSYGTISDDGRVQAVRRLFDECREAGALGDRILTDMAAEHPRLRLRRRG